MKDISIAKVSYSETVMVEMFVTNLPAFITEFMFLVRDTCDANKGWVP